MLITTAIKIKTSKSDIKKDGTTPIYLYLNINGDRKMVSTGKYILPTQFDNDKGLIKRGNDSMKLNSILAEFKVRYDSAIWDLQRNNDDINFEAIESYIKSKMQGENPMGGKDRKDFIAFAFTELKLLNASIAPKYYDVLEFHLKTFKGYKDKIYFNELNFTFLESYQFYLIRKGYKINSMSGAFRCIRLFINKARKKDLTTINPFINFKIKSQETEIEHLTLEEVLMLHDLYDQGTLSDKLQNTLHYFLISCYTGLRRSDCKRLDKSHIEAAAIKIMPQKTKRTGKFVRIPLNDRAKKLLNMEMESFFNRPLKQSNSRTNNDLKEILGGLGITKHITFHCSRHSFAVNSLVLGIPLEVVSSILGHCSVKTTQIYAKVVDELKMREMMKWNALDNFKVRKVEVVDEELIVS